MKKQIHRHFSVKWKTCNMRRKKLFYEWFWHVHQPRHEIYMKRERKKKIWLTSHRRLYYAHKHVIISGSATHIAFNSLAAVKFPYTISFPTQTLFDSIVVDVWCEFWYTINQLLHVLSIRLIFLLWPDAWLMVVAVIGWTHTHHQKHSHQGN